MLGLIDVRIINFVHDPVTQREPDAATGVIRRADALFRARTSSAAQSPARQTPLNSQANSCPKRLDDSNPNSKSRNTVVDEEAFDSLARDHSTLFRRPVEISGIPARSSVSDAES